MLLLLLLGSGLAGGSIGCGEEPVDPGAGRATVAPPPAAAALAAASPPPGSHAGFVGSAACVGCHPAQATAWRASDHDRAMEEATPETVAGRFDGRTFRHYEQTWRFLRDGPAFVVESEVASSDPASPATVERLRVDFTFGFEPLQQYLVARPGGRWQALPVAWDTRPAEAGGQRWFSLWPDMSIPVGDALHWDQPAYNWNSQCAACHSTALAKGFDAVSGHFETTSAELDVACEACHGPGRAHVENPEPAAGTASDTSDAALRVRFEPYSADRWQRHGSARIARRAHAPAPDAEIEVCAPCHSRRSELSARPEVGAPFLDGYRPALLEPGLYFDDGQIRQEVYVWGSFAQSRMAAAGVRCSDCHDSHALSLRREGNALCTGCHSPEAYDGASHHGHAVGEAEAEGESEQAPGVGSRDPSGIECVDCHMPTRTYMNVDRRRDHSFPLPRPRRNAALGAPDVCESCHVGRGVDWAEDAIAEWRGARPARPHWADALVRDGVARRDPERWLEIALDRQYPAIVRGSAWARYAAEANAAPARSVLEDRLEGGEPLERLGLMEVARRLDPALRLSLLDPLLEAPRRAIRIAAAEALVDVPARFFRPDRRAAFTRALRESREALAANAERPEAQVSLGSLALQQGDVPAARAAYRAALERAAYFLPAYLNLADLERAAGDERAAIEWLRRGLEVAPEEATLRYALGLALHRAGEASSALVELERASKSAPDSPRLTLGWALGLDAAGRRQEAIGVLEAAVERGAGDADVYQALVTFMRDSGQTQRALAHAEQWLRSDPQAPNARALVEQLEALTGARDQARPD